jgi:hypothetical protein
VFDFSDEQNSPKFELGASLLQVRSHEFELGTSVIQVRSHEFELGFSIIQIKMSLKWVPQ